MEKSNFAKEQFSSMPPWAKGVIAIGILAGVGFLAYKLIKASKDLKQGKGSREEDRAVNNDLDKLITNGKGPSLSQSQIMGSANTLFTAMDGYASDESAIYSVFAKAKNDADVLAIIKAYGIREVSSGKLNPEPNIKGSLSMALTSELSRTEIGALNMLLAKKGIKHRF